MLLCWWLLVGGTGRYATSDEGLEPSSSVVVFWVQCIIHLYGMFNPQNTVVLDVPGTWYGTSVVSKYLVRASVYRYYCFCCWWWCGGCCVVVGTHTHTTLERAFIRAYYYMYSLTTTPLFLLSLYSFLPLSFSFFFSFTTFNMGSKKSQQSPLNLRGTLFRFPSSATSGGKR